MREKQQFSKALLIQESILIWIITLSFIGLALICIVKGYLGELGWLSAMAGFPWAAYAVSQACYYKKARQENTKDGIVYDAAMATFNSVEEDEVSEEDEEIN